MVDGLIEMANLDYRAAGLETFGKPDGFLERQVDRWLGQLATYPAKYDKYEGRKLPGLDTVVDWLRANVPESWRPGLMHGDYAMNNVLFANAPPARLVAIVDWETATIGDPMLDLAAFTMNMRSRDGTEKIWSYFEPERFPYREDAIAYYGERTGRDISPIDYYYVLYRFRAACILEYKVAEAIQGLSPKAKGDRFDGLVRMLMESAESLVRKLG
jgi:aminoglycoside phosphotransferase (APT) family kinase protein